MNFSELARKINIMPNDLREKLSRLGFDIGRKAIKVDDKIAKKIINDWPLLVQRLAKLDEQDVVEEVQQVVEARIVKLPKRLTIKALSQTLLVPLPKLMLNLMNNGILLSANEYIDFNTAAIVAEDFNIKSILEEIEHSESPEQILDLESEIKKRLASLPKDQLITRPPIVVIVGHIDHGKTTLLDKIRETSVVKGEAGHITQHIGAYQIVKKGNLLTFIDTPGHEIFTSIRSRGARVADIAILVVAADDGVQEQTKEAIKIVQAAKLPIIVAINKIDKEAANIELIKSNLASLNLAPEDFGGTTICVPISAKVGTGIDNLLDMILLVAGMQKEQLLADNQQNAIGTIIESHVSPKEGVSATALIRSGILKVNDFITIDKLICGKVRSLKNFLNESVKTASPSMPVKILGLKICPTVGSIIEAVQESEIVQFEKAKQIIVRQSQELHKISWAQPVTQAADDTSGKESQDSATKMLNIILKTDVSGSQEAIITGLEQFNANKQRVKIISSSLGNVTETDLIQAQACHAIVVGFNVSIRPAVLKMIEDTKVFVKTYNVIYSLLEDIRGQLVALSGPETEQVVVGEISVRKIFITEKEYTLIGGMVMTGNINNNLQCIIQRDGKKVADGTIVSVRISKENIALVTEGEECGIKVQTRHPILVGDILKVYITKEIEEVI